MPLLGFYASVVAIIGGALLSYVTLDIPFVTFIQRIREVVPITDLYVGLIKAPVFGAIIAIAGCFPGHAGRIGRRAGRQPDHGRGRPSRSSSYRARRLLRGVLHLAGVELMTEGDPIIRCGACATRSAAGGARRPRPRRPARRNTRRRRRVGDGKSVLMRSIIGLQQPEAGEITVFGEPTLDREEADTVDVRRRWGVLFQGGALFSTLTVAENVQVPLREFYPGLSQAMLDQISSFKVVMTGLPPEAGPNTPPSCRAA
jgi:hypothetical protein